MRARTPLPTGVSAHGPPHTAPPFFCQICLSHSPARLRDVGLENGRLVTRLTGQVQGSLAKIDMDCQQHDRVRTRRRADASWDPSRPMPPCSATDAVQRVPLPRDSLPGMHALHIHSPP